jgi:hypothetical protein
MEKWAGWWLEIPEKGYLPLVSHQAMPIHSVAYIPLPCKIEFPFCWREWETQAKTAFPVVLSGQSDHILVRRRINWIVWLMWWRLFTSRSAHLLAAIYGASRASAANLWRWCVLQGIYCATRLTSKISPGRLLVARNSLLIFKLTDRVLAFPNAAELREKGEERRKLNFLSHREAPPCQIKLSGICVTRDAEPPSSDQGDAANFFNIYSLNISRLVNFRLSLTCKHVFVCTLKFFLLEMFVYWEYRTLQVQSQSRGLQAGVYMTGHGDTSTSTCITINKK